MFQVSMRAEIPVVASLAMEALFAVMIARMLLPFDSVSCFCFLLTMTICGI
jgi:hypothetical protein